ncbi:MAG: hypothetical protein ACRENA_13140 [Vulcanimicrobiaceae bacterium]
MSLVEFMHARKMFSWFAGIAVVLGILSLTATRSIHATGAHSHPFTLSGIFSASGYASCIMATMLTATLNRDREHLAYIWTRPTPRERIALGYMIVDVATIVLAYVVIAALVIAVVDGIPFMHFKADSSAGISFVRFLAIPLMWYGLVEAATSWNKVKGSAAAGLSWAFFWMLLLALAIPMPAPLHAILDALNFLNPLAYFVTQHGDSVIIDPVSLSEVKSHVVPLAYAYQTILAYAIFLVGCVVATVAWRRTEA